MDQCPKCGGEMLGDGYTLPYHCIDAYEEDWWYCAPDEGPFYCDYEEEE